MRERQPWRRTAVSVAVVDIAAVVLVLSGSLESPVRELVADLTGVVGAVVAAAAFAWTGWCQVGDERRWRWLMVVALAWFAAAHTLWTWYRSIDPMTFPNAANALYLGLPFFAFFAVLGMVRKDHGKVEEHGVVSPSSVVMLDGLIIVGSLVALSWKLIFDAVRYVDSVRVSRLLMVSSYTLAHLVLIAIAILFAIALCGILRFPIIWLVSGLLAIGLSDAVYVYAISNSFTPPPVADVGYMIGPILFLLTALVPCRPYSQVTPRMPLLFLPYVPFAVVCGFTLFTTISTGDPHAGEVYALIGVVALVVLRQLITLRQLYVARRQLVYQATHDPLTGASCRNLLLFRLGEALSRDQQARRIGLLYADLDHFKEINDLLGHEAGDTVLCAVASRLKACIRSTDTLARIGGDEFVILLNPAPEDPHEFGRRIQSAFDEPVFIGDSSRTISVSLGYVGLNDDSAENALARADEAMYQAKAAGRNGMRINL